MIKVALVRGKYLNNFEGQNYRFNDNKIKLTGISSYFPLHNNFPFVTKKLLSIADVNLGRIGKAVFNRLLGDSQILLGLENLADDFDIFHTADPHYYYSYQLAKLRRRNLVKKLIVTSWETIAFNNETVGKKKRNKYFVLNNADKFICYSEKAKKCLVKEGVDVKKISVVRLGVDIDNFKYQKQESKNKVINVLFVGRLVEEKGILDLYEGFKNVKRQMSNVKTNLKLRIIGEGYLKSKLLKIISKDGLKDYVSVEQKKYEEMPEVYLQADIFVLPSKKTKTWEEQYGMVLIEAMASGLPIIAYNTGAIPENISQTGILIDPNIKRLAEKLIFLIDNLKLRSKLGRMGRERVEKEFDSKETAFKIKKIYEDLMYHTGKK